MTKPVIGPFVSDPRTRIQLSDSVPEVFGKRNLGKKKRTAPKFGGPPTAPRQSKPVRRVIFKEQVQEGAVDIYTAFEQMNLGTITSASHGKDKKTRPKKKRTEVSSTLFRRMDPVLETRKKEGIKRGNSQKSLSVAQTVPGYRLTSTSTRKTIGEATAGTRLGGCLLYVAS